jgi:MbtH protein
MNRSRIEGKGAVMNELDEEDTPIFRVEVNHEEQYLTWPVDRENRRGWHDVGKDGTQAECPAHIAEAWTNMRPPSHRGGMEETAFESLAAMDRQDPAQHHSASAHLGRRFP